MGSYRIIEMKILTPACIWNHIGFQSRMQRLGLRTTSIALLTFAALLAPSAASASVTGAVRAGENVQTVKMAQYQSASRGQYHEIASGSRPTSAWLRGTRASGPEFDNSISGRVISRLFPIPSRNSISPVTIRTRSSIGERNDRSIGSQIGPESSRDPRLMLQIGGVLGLVYIAFLAIWFWATRTGMRPPRSAPF